MRIALVVDWHSEKMGYSDNFLPRALAALGHEVHLITSDAQAYFNSPIYKDIFEKFLGPGVVECGTWKRDGYTLHRLPHDYFLGRLRIRGLISLLRELRPEIVQTGEIISFLTVEAAVAKPFLGYKLFVECHVHASVFPLAQLEEGKSGKASLRARLYWPIYAKTLGWAVGRLAERCYPISSDSADLAVRFFGFDRHKLTVRSLGVDTELFRPVAGDELARQRLELRGALGYSDEDTVCIYTGRISEEKAPLCLARAVAVLRQKGLKFRGLFMGDGPVDYVNRIAAIDGCRVHPFVPVQDLARYYQAADIGVWPRQESTSQLDAVACGLPIVLSDQIHVTERVADNGLLYRQEDSVDLARCLEVLGNPALRREMGLRGAARIQRDYAWKDIAKKYANDYATALGDGIA